MLSAIFLLSACGYHLRGSQYETGQVKKIALLNASGPLHRQMQLTLRSTGGQLLDKADNAEVVVYVNHEKMDRRVLSISSVGKANEFELIYRLNYSMLDTQGKPLLESAEMEIYRDYFNDQEDILAKNNEELIIREEMYRQAIRTLFAKARAVLRQ